VRFRARGASMQPLVRDGDVVLVRPVAARAVRVGDVVLFKSSPEHVVVHRVIRRSGDQNGYAFQVKGDSLSRPDAVIAEAQVFGRVDSIDREGLHIDMNRPLMRLLSWLAVLRWRWKLERSAAYRLAKYIFRNLPVLSRYLA